jgi:hypothetical protein
VPADTDAFIDRADNEGATDGGGLGPEYAGVIIAEGRDEDVVGEITDDG